MVIPLYKYGDKNVFINYRPVSIIAPPILQNSWKKFQQ